MINSHYVPQFILRSFYNDNTIVYYDKDSSVFFITEITCDFINTINSSRVVVVYCLKNAV